jgi:hypothetical protein
MDKGWDEQCLVAPNALVKPVQLSGARQNATRVPARLGSNLGQWQCASVINHDFRASN